MGARWVIYSIVAILLASGWAATYATYQENQRLEEAKAQMTEAIETSEKRAKQLAREIKSTNKELIEVRRDRRAIDAQFDALSNKLDKAVRNATEAQRACMDLEHGDAVGDLLRAGASNDNGN